MNFFKTSYQSPVGMLQITCSDDALCSVHFLEERDFSGMRKLFQIPMLQNGTPFQTKVWTLLEAIPYGRTISYMDLSKRFGDVKAIRAVASANGKNNIAIIVPCHRVIGTNQSLTGYAGGLWRKQWLLAHEAKFNNGVQELF